MSYVRPGRGLRVTPTPRTTRGPLPRSGPRTPRRTPAGFKQKRFRREVEIHRPTRQSPYAAGTVQGGSKGEAWETDFRRTSLVSCENFNRHRVGSSSSAGRRSMSRLGLPRWRVRVTRSATEGTERTGLVETGGPGGVAHATRSRHPPTG